MYHFHHHHYHRDRYHRPESHALVLVTAPTVEPISLEEARKNSRVAEEEDDDIVTSMIVAARTYFEETDNRRLCTQTWQMKLDFFPLGNSIIELPLRPVREVSHIKYTDTDGMEQTLAADLYQTDINSMFARIKPAIGQHWPLARHGLLNPIEIEFVVGYDGETIVGGIPENLKRALLILTGHFYENREATAAGLPIAPVPIDRKSVV